MLYIIHKYKITVHSLEQIVHDGGVKEREQRVAGRRDINGPLSFPSPLFFYTLHKPQRCHSPTHPTAATTQPSGSILDRASLVCSFLLYETQMYGK